MMVNIREGNEQRSKGQKGVAVYEQTINSLLAAPFSLYDSVASC